MRIHLAADHRGWDLAKQLEGWLASKGHEVLWHGAEFKDDGDDYPLFAIRTAQAQLADEDAGVEAKSIVVGGDGSGEVISANKVSGARAAIAMNAKQVELARAQADVSLLVIGSYHLNFEQAQPLVELFFATPFSDLIDDARRIINTTEFENSGTIEGWMIGYQE